MMNWRERLCRERLEQQDDDPKYGINPFRKDVERIVSSSAFRHDTEVLSVGHFQ
jgi:dGTP triphosphohydrolase